VESPPEHSSNENEEEVLFSRQMTLDKTEPVSSEHVENIESNNEERVEMKGIVEGTTLPVEEPPKESILDLQENTAEIVPEQEPEVSHSDEMGPEKFVAEKKSDEITLDLVESNSVDKPSGEEKSGEVIVASEVMELVEDPTERPAEELNPVILSDSDSDDILQVPPEAWTGEDSEEFKEEKRENRPPAGRATSANVQTGVGRGATPQVIIPRQASGSSKTSSARRRRNARRS